MWKNSISFFIWYQLNPFSFAPLYILKYFNPLPRIGEFIIGIHLSVCLSLTFHIRAITYVCIDGLPSNLVQMSSLRRCAYIQEYLGSRANNLYFLFSHSWPVEVYTFGQVQCTSQVERKTNVLKSTCRRYSRPLSCNCYF